MEQIHLETMEQLLTLQWQPVILTIFNYNRINSQEWECMDCHHFMETFMVSFDLENGHFDEKSIIFDQKLQFSSIFIVQKCARNDWKAQKSPFLNENGLFRGIFENFIIFRAFFLNNLTDFWSSMPHFSLISDGELNRVG